MKAIHILWLLVFPSAKWDEHLLHRRDNEKMLVKVLWELQLGVVILFFVVFFCF